MSVLIKQKLVELHKSQVDLIFELRNRNYKIAQTELNRFINGVTQSPKANMIMAEVGKILKEWEGK